MMALDWTPLRHRLRTLREGGRATLAEVCSGRIVLSPAVSQRVPPAIHLPGQLARAGAVQYLTGWAEELRRIRGGPRTWGASVAYVLRGGALLDGIVYQGAYRRYLLPRRSHLWTRRPTVRGGRGALACTLTGNRYFGHWLTDDVTMSLAADAVGPPVVAPRPAYAHEAGYRELLGLPALRTVEAARFHELFVIDDDVQQNAYKRERYRELRRRLRARVRPEGPTRGVYLRRGSGGGIRRLTNEPEIEATLRHRGFRVLDAERLDARALVAGLLDAPVVVGVEGSTLAHAVYGLADGGAVLALQPQDRFNNVHKDYADCLGARYAFLIGSGTRRGFRIDPRELSDTLDLVEAAL